MKSRILSLIAATVLALSASAADFKTDRSWYLAGEAMTVSVTADDALIAYAELCDTQGMVAGVMVGLRAGEGTGIIELPPSLHSGYYVLSVYTRDNAQVSQQLVAVVNPLHKSEDDDIEWVSITHPDSLSYQSSMVNGQWSIVNGQSPDVRETEGHIIKARVKNVYEGHTYRGEVIRPSLGIVGRQIHYFEGKMVNDSTAVFFTYGVQGRQSLVLSAVTSTGVSLPVEMISPFAALLPKSLPHLVFHYQRSEVEARSLAMQRHQLAIQPDTVPDYDETLFGVQPDLTYNLDEYRQFFTIREVLLEYVKFVYKKKYNGVHKLFVSIEQDHYKDVLPTLVLIDGMPVNDVDRLLKYDARRIHHINLYDGQYTFGHDIYNGILSFVTRSGRLTNYPTERNAQYLVYEFPYIP